MRKSRIILIISIICLIIAITVSGCSSWQRTTKTISSDLSGGLNREIIVYDSVGNELFRQKGKFDIEYTNERVMYDDENNLRHIIYFKNGVVIVNEIEE